IASFLAVYPEPYHITGVKYGWCLRCEVVPDIMSGLNGRPRRRHPQQYDDMSVEAANDMGLGMFENRRNFTNAHVGSNIYSGINVEQLHQLLKRVFIHYKLKWMVEHLKDIYGARKGIGADT
ncbi:hypothetical protein K440DRAFT_573737, partial [Wilcoxina mikolae CBS 423.85]